MSSLRDQIETALETATWGSELPTTAHPEHRYHGACGLCQGAVRQIAAVAAEAVQPVLDGKDAEIERLKAALHRADAKAALREAVREDVEIDMETLAEERDEAEKHAEQAEAERDQLRADLRASREATTRWEASSVKAERERNRLQAAIERVQEIHECIPCGCAKCRGRREGGWGAPDEVCRACSIADGAFGAVVWPCPTIAALDHPGKETE